MLRRNFTLMSLLLVAAALLPNVALAAAVDVSPVLVELSDAVPSSTIVLTNQGAKPARFHITAHAWSQKADGEAVLTPTSDIVFFPAMLTLGPKALRQVRVGSKVKPGAVERTYRLIVEELPPLQSEVEPGTVSMLMKMSLPVFVKAASPKATASLGPLAVVGRELQFTIKNTGNSHVKVRKLLLVSKGAEGTVDVEDLKGWYVLAGASTTYKVRLSDAVCLKASSLEVQMELAEATTKAALGSFRCVE